MRKKLLITALTVLLIILTVSFVTVHSSADFGDYAGDNDYGDYGGYDYGDYGDSEGGSGLLDLFGILSWLSGTGLLIPALIIGFILIVIIGAKMNTGSAPVVPATKKTPQSELLTIDSLKQKDPAFSESDVSSMVSNLYIRLQNCWTAKNIEELRPYLSDALYSKSDAQLDAYRKNGTTNKVDRPTVLGVEIRGWKKNGDTDSLIIALRTRIVDYVERDSDGYLIRGSRTSEKFMEYEWELVRSSDMKTKAKDEQTVHNCPNCGAPLNINRTAKCEYCGSIITVKEFDWVLDSIKGISQRTS